MRVKAVSGSPYCERLNCGGQTKMPNFTQQMTGDPDKVLKGGSGFHHLNSTFLCLQNRDNECWRLYVKTIGGRELDMGTEYSW